MNAFREHISRAKLTGVLLGVAEGLDVGEGVGQVTAVLLVQHP